ncbi:MAG: alpha-amylase family glycosyl hydrolase [Mucilaginibacter sp.]
MKRTPFVLLMIWIALGFYPGISTAQTTNSQTNQPYPKQYGKPFKYVPDALDINLYQVNTRSFSKEGNFKGVITRLDSIKALGINVVYIMPIYPVGTLKGKDSPYATKDYNAVGSEFGTLDDLRALVDGAHKRKMAVMLDFVANHTSWDNPWIANKSWYEQDSNRNIKYPSNWEDVAQLNFKNDDMRLALVRSMKSWVLKANIDGFRCDYADGPPADFWKQAIDTLKNIKTHKLLMLAEGSKASNYTAGFDLNFGFNFYGTIKSVYGRSRSVKTIDAANTREYAGATAGQGMVRYLTNHDVNSSDGTAFDLFGGQKGSMAAFVVVAYMKGVPMVYNGQEIGTPFRLVFPFTNSKIDWGLSNPELTAFYKKVLAFRTANATVRRGALETFSSDDVCVFTKTIGAKKVLVLANLRNKPVSYAVPPTLANSKWHDAFSGTKTTIGGTVNLEPYAYQILKN